VAIYFTEINTNQDNLFGERSRIYFQDNKKWDEDSNNP
jgi:hypothetical protein